MRTVLVCAVAALALLWSGCTDAGGEPRRDEQGNMTEQGDVSVFHLHLGDCTQDPTLGEVSNVAATPCDQPHAYEVFAVTQYEGDEYRPVSIDAFAQSSCAAAFSGFVGLPVDDSGLSMTYITPTEPSFGAGDREISCLVGSDADPTSGSLRGARR